MNEISESSQRPAKSAWPQAVQCFRFRWPNVHSSSNVQIKGSNARSPLSQSQAFLADTECLFRFLPFSDILHHAYNPLHIALGVELSPTVPLHPNGGAVEP